MKSCTTLWFEIPIHFLSKKRASLFTTLVLVKVPRNNHSKWCTKSYKGDHIKDELAEEHANTRWRCCLAKVPLQPSMSSSYCTSCCTQGACIFVLTGWFLLHLVPKSKSPYSSGRWESRSEASSSLNLHYSRDQRVQLLPRVFTVPLYLSTVSRSVYGPRSKEGAGLKTFQFTIVIIHRAWCVSACGFVYKWQSPSWQCKFPPSPTNVQILKALIETSTAVGTTFSKTNVFMSISIYVSSFCPCCQKLNAKYQTKVSKRAQPKRDLQHTLPNNSHYECICSKSDTRCM